MQILDHARSMRPLPSRTCPLLRNLTRAVVGSVSIVGDNNLPGGGPSRQPLEAGGFPVFWAIKAPEPNPPTSVSEA